MMSSLKEAVERVKRTVKDLADEISSIRPKPSGEIVERVATKKVLPRGIVRRIIAKRLLEKRERIGKH